MRTTVLLVALSACGGDNSQPPVGGPTRTFVISYEGVPRNNHDTRPFALDIDGDGTADNQLGLVIGTLVGQLDHEFFPQAFTDVLIDRGGVMQVIALQTPGPDDDGTIGGISLQTATNPDPSPCGDADDTACRRHLTGNALFELAAPMPDALPVDNDRRTMYGPGQLQVVLGFFGTPVLVDLHAARIELIDPDPAHLTGVIGGAIPAAQVAELVISQVPVYLNMRVQRDCDALAEPPLCGCRTGTLGKSILNIFDKDHDCSINTNDLLASPLIQSLIAPDIDKKFLSVGFGFEAVPAQLR